MIVQLTYFLIITIVMALSINKYVIYTGIVDQSRYYPHGLASMIINVHWRTCHHTIDSVDL